MLLVSKDLLQPLDGVGVDGFMIPVKGGLPVGVVAAVEAIRSFPCRQCCITLPPPELWFISRCLRCPCVAADVQDCDALAVLLCEVREEVWIRVPVWWLLPCFPDCAELDNHFGRCCGVFGEGYKARKEGSAFVLWSWCHSGDGAKALQLSHGLAVKTQAKDPELTSGVIV